MYFSKAKKYPFISLFSRSRIPVNCLTISRDIASSARNQDKVGGAILITSSSRKSCRVPIVVPETSVRFTWVKLRERCAVKFINNFNNDGFVIIHAVVDVL